MAREIKYHYWNSGEGKMYYQPENGWDSFPYKHDDKDEWLQFTGLHDKNGKEIYEGDVVTQKMPSREVWNGWVVFERGAFRIREIPTEDDPKVYNKDLIGGLAEVIGNIYEKP